MDSLPECHCLTIPPVTFPPYAPDYNGMLICEICKGQVSPPSKINKKITPTQYFFLQEQAQKKRREYRFKN